MVTKFCTPTPGCYTGKMFVNVSKIRTNSFLIPQPDISKIICDVPKWAQESEWMLYEPWCYIIYLFMHQFMYLCEGKKSFNKIPDVINIDFPQI